jgi:1-aminocyclopropane-1-carboxylate deaminase/D-cysteine desulfhydrase-like pyridoxal-dependent ACC family enzyme
MSEQRKELFRRAYNLEQEIVQAQELLKDLKAEFSYDKEFNTQGLPKKDVAKVMKAAKAKAAQNNLKEKAEELLEVDALIEELE